MSKQVVGAGAVVLGILGEGLLVWGIEALPRWAQIAVLGPGALVLLVGVALIVRDRIQARRRPPLRAPANRPAKPAPGRAARSKPPPAPGAAKPPRPPTDPP